MTPKLHLSARQVEVCCLVASGESDKGVARELDIKPITARFHLVAAAKKIREHYDISGSPRDVVVAWYAECRRLAFARKAAA